MKTAIKNVILNGAGSSQEKAIVYLAIVIPAIIAFLAFGHISKF